MYILPGFQICYQVDPATHAQITILKVRKNVKIKDFLSNIFFIKMYLSNLLVIKYINRYN